MRDQDKRPIIGVTCSIVGDRPLWLFNRLSIWRAGGLARRLTSNSPATTRGLDALVIGGGDDIDARLYGGTIEPTVAIDPARDGLELALLAEAFERRLPVLGICRGAQMLNVFLGGSLIDCIFARDPNMPRLRSYLPRKTVEIEAGARLAGILGRTRCRVNALHHQAVERPAERVAVVARDEYGIIQAIEVPAEPFVIGVQWHPEFLVFDRGQRQLFHALIQAAVARPDQPRH